MGLRVGSRYHLFFLKLFYCCLCYETVEKYKSYRRYKHFGNWQFLEDLFFHDVPLLLFEIFQFHCQNIVKETSRTYELRFRLNGVFSLLSF